jgi:hypothetical protein
MTILRWNSEYFLRKRKFFIMVIMVIMVIVWPDACHSAAEIRNDVNCHAAAASSGLADLIS